MYTRWAERGEKDVGRFNSRGLSPLAGTRGVKRWPGEADGHMLPSGIEIAVR